MGENIEASLLREANQILLERNRQLVDALSDMLTLEPTIEQRARAIEVWRKEAGAPTLSRRTEPICRRTLCAVQRMTASFHKEATAAICTGCSASATSSRGCGLA